jgi:anti-sigma factor RsiW
MDQNDDISTVQDPDTEELTAYLDGELDADARAAVEHRLAEDEAFRQRMQRMEDAWAMLDALPRTEADGSFTQSTVEMVALAAREEVAELETGNRRRSGPPP